MSQVSERVRRLLTLVPTVARSRDGVPVAELTERLGISEDELHAELDFLMMVGKPPFSPGDFFDIYVEGDRVFAALSQSLNRPPRLTHDEALALAVGAQAVMAGASGEWVEALRAVIERIESAMNEAEGTRFRELRARIALQGDPATPDDVHRTLRNAVDRCIPLTIRYYSASSNTYGDREVLPYAIVSHQGNWYLVAGPDGADGYKMFRFDRIESAAPGGEPGSFEVPEHVRPSRVRMGFVRMANQGAAPRVRVSPEKARFARAQLGDDNIEEQPDGSVIVELKSAGWEWVCSWVLSFGADAEVLEPEALRQRVIEDAKRALQAYR